MQCGNKIAKNLRGFVQILYDRAFVKVLIQGPRDGKMIGAVSVLVLSRISVHAILNVYRIDDTAGGNRNERSVKNVAKTGHRNSVPCSFNNMAMS